MSGVEVVASIIGIVGFALDVSQKLYIFAATTRAAGEEAEYIARSISNFSSALEILAEELDEDDDEPIHSKAAVEFVHRLYDQSTDLFEEIDDMIPKPGDRRDDLTFMQKVKWSFQKARVQFLAGQLESLKSTVSLIATVLMAGKVIRSKRTKHRSHRHKKRRSRSQPLEQVRQKAQVAIIAQIQSVDALTHLSQKTKEEMSLLSGPTPGNPDRVLTMYHNNNTRILTDDLRSLAIRQEDHDKCRSDDMGSKQLVLQRTPDIFDALLMEYTTLDQLPEGKDGMGQEMLFEENVDESLDGSTGAETDASSIRTESVFAEDIQEQPQEDIPNNIWILREKLKSPNESVKTPHISENGRTFFVCCTGDVFLKLLPQRIITEHDVKWVHHPKIQHRDFAFGQMPKPITIVASHCLSKHALWSFNVKFELRSVESEFGRSKFEVGYALEGLFPTQMLQMYADLSQGFFDLEKHARGHALHRNNSRGSSPTSEPWSRNTVRCWYDSDDSDDSDEVYGVVDDDDDNESWWTGFRARSTKQDSRGADSIRCGKS